MGELGLFDGQNVELLDGEIYQRDSKTPRHYSMMDAIGEQLRRAFVAGFWVRTGGPLALGDRSEPEPDVSVVAGQRDDYKQAHPASALLVVEVGRSPLSLDRGLKSRIYAKAGIPEFWIIDLVGRSLEVHREPGLLESNKACRHVYRSVTLLGLHDTVYPIAKPEAVLEVRHLFG